MYKMYPPTRYRLRARYARRRSWLRVVGAIVVVLGLAWWLGVV